MNRQETYYAFKEFGDYEWKSERQIKQDGAYLKIKGRFHKGNSILKLILRV